MARKNSQDAIRETREGFDQLSRQVDVLASEEQTLIVDPREAALQLRPLRELARQTTAALNSAAPDLPSDKISLLRDTSRMLSELALAETAPLFFDKFHSRREDIDAGLAALAI